MDVTTAWNEIVPDRFEVMAARGVELENSRDMATAYPDLFPTEKSATRYRQEAGRKCPSPYERSPIGKWAPPRRIQYQPAGGGKKPRFATFFGDIDPLAWLKDRLGVEIKLLGQKTTSSEGPRPVEAPESLRRLPPASPPHASEHRRDNPTEPGAGEISSPPAE